MSNKEAEIQKYINEKRELHNLVLTFLENIDDKDEEDFKKLIKFMELTVYGKGKNEMEHFLRLIVSIANNHHRHPLFFTKIEKILQNSFKVIKQNFSNKEIFEIFKSSKPLLLYLFNNSLLQNEWYIQNQIMNLKDPNGICYCHFFYPEVKSIEQNGKKVELNQAGLENYEEKRQEGENDSFICKLIRNDSIVDFISYVSQKSISVNSTIKKSIFETNSFLLKQKEIELIEYAAFFGSIQIFNYLLKNGAHLNSSSWLYAIHSQNAEMISFLEENRIEPDTSECLKEAIKCHHNNVARYIYQNLIDQSKRLKLDDFVISSIYNYENYSYFPYDNDKNDTFYYMIQFNYSNLVKIYLQIKDNEIKEYIIINTFYFINNISHLVLNFNKYFFLNKNAIQLAADDNNLLIVFYLLNKLNSIDSDLFKGNKNLTRIVFPSTITKIEENSFEKCESLTEISIPSSITEIGKVAFSNCNNLKYVSIQSSLISINDYVFSYCSSLQEINIPSSVTYIGKYAFCGCSSLKKIDLPDLVVYIGPHAFHNCSSLCWISIPHSLSKIEQDVFNGCLSLRNITIPSTVTRIEEGAFENCSPNMIVHLARITCKSDLAFPDGTQFHFDS